MKNRQQNLTQYAADILTVERHVVEATKRQSESDGVQEIPEAGLVIGQIQTTLERHVDTLEAYLGEHEDDVSVTLKEALGSVLGAAAGLYDKLRGEDPVSRMLRDNYTALGLCAVSYHMLYTTALGAKDAKLQRIALDHLKDISPLVVEVSKSICRVVARELAQEGKIDDPGVGELAVLRTQEAWTSDVTEPAAD